MPEVWHGLQTRYTSGSIVYLQGLGSPDFDGEPCKIEGFSTEKQKWSARFLHPRFQNQSVFVPEENLSFGYSIDAGCAQDDDGAGVLSVSAQGECGRGLEAAKACPEGELLFEESPFVVSADDLNEMCRVYYMLRNGATSDKTTREALDAFDELTMGDLPKETVEKTQVAAEGIFEDMHAGNPAAKAAFENNPIARDVELAMLTGIMLRWEANRFRLKGGSGRHGLFRLSSSMNHSCRPTAVSSTELSPLAAGSMVPGDGRVVVRATVALEAGDPLCINYGPPELEQWPLERRRSYLLKHNGFVCRCPRCLEESGEAAE